MNRTTIRNVILLATILLIGLIATQIFWIRKAYDINERQFNHDITVALKNVVAQIMVHNNDSSVITDPITQVSTNYFRVSINDTLHPYYLESLLKSEFKLQEINVDFEYSIYDCFTNEVEFQNSVSLDDSKDVPDIQEPDLAWQNDGHYFGVFFPSKSSGVIYRMKFWMLSTLVLFCVAIFFAYAIRIILRQKRLSEIQRNFINNMTHELKTPISTIGLSADALSSDQIIDQPKRLKKYAEIIKKENIRLKTLADRVLQIGTIDNREIQLNNTKIELNNLIQVVVNGFELQLKQCEGQISFTPCETPIYVLGDEVHLTNVLSNLMDNAIKYCEQTPKIEITASCQQEVVLTIADNGIGIDKENLKLVFDKFYRVNTGDRHDVKGFGLGLNYVRSIIQEHHGSIKAKSSLGKGTTFTIKLPKHDR